MTAQALFTNGAISTLAAAITAGAGSLTVQASDGGKFPQPSGSDWFMATIGDHTAYEIVRCTARSNDTLTVIRGQDGTATMDHASGAAIILGDAKASMRNIKEAVREEDTALASPLISVQGSGGLVGGGQLSGDVELTLDRATNAQAIAGQDTRRAITPIRMREVAEHKTNANIASEAQAIAGSDNQKFITPQRMHPAADKAFLDKRPTQQEAEEVTRNDRFMTPLRMKQAIDENPSPLWELVTVHASSVSNTIAFVDLAGYKLLRVVGAGCEFRRSIRAPQDNPSMALSVEFSSDNGASYDTSKSGYRAISVPPTGYSVRDFWQEAPGALRGMPIFRNLGLNKAIFTFHMDLFGMADSHSTFLKVSTMGRSEYWSSGRERVLHFHSNARGYQMKNRVVNAIRLVARLESGGGERGDPPYFVSGQISVFGIKG